MSEHAELSAPLIPALGSVSRAVLTTWSRRAFLDDEMFFERDLVLHLGFLVSKGAFL